MKTFAQQLEKSNFKIRSQKGASLFQNVFLLIFVMRKKDRQFISTVKTTLR